VPLPRFDLNFQQAIEIEGDSPKGGNPRMDTDIIHSNTAEDKGAGNESTIPTSSTIPNSEVALHFLTALFDSGDHVLIRPIETWTEELTKKSRVVYQSQDWPQAGTLSTVTYWKRLLDIAKAHRANLFFGVCPRPGPTGQYDLSWQIRTVRALWADLDHCT